MATVAKTAAVVALLSLGLLVLGVAVSTLYDEYGSHPEQNARVWAGAAPTYADRAVCQTCHAAEYAEQTASKHRGVVCESCHGPLGAHAVADPIAAMPLPTPTGARCAACHEASAGRPAGFPQVDPATHYQAGSCLQCHAAHSTVALLPPEVSHPLERLPGCTVCHAPQGLKKVPAGHEEVADAVCLGCHRPATARQQGGTVP